MESGFNWKLSLEEVKCQDGSWEAFEYFVVKG